LDAVLPSFIGVDFLMKTDADFSPMHHVRGKWYRYYVWNLPCRQALWEQKAWQVPYELDLKLLGDEFCSLLGTHDFRSFCASGSGAKTTVREIYDLAINQYGSLIVFDILGKGFLKHMIRIMMGTLIDVARGQLQLSLHDILAARDRRTAGYTAPSHGLSLMGMYLDDGVRSLTLAKDLALQARPWMECYGLDRA
jgi:tRNA pseudouridine38-40 synthase